MQLSFQKIFYVLATLFAFLAVLILAKSVLIPLAFALLISFILFPICVKIESWGAGKVLAVSVSLFTLLLVVGGIVLILSNLIMNQTENITDFKDKIIRLFADITLYTNKNLGFVGTLEKGELYEKLKSWLNISWGSLLSQTFSSTSEFLLGLVTAMVFTFLILIYRKGLVHAFIHFYPQENRKKALEMFKSIQHVGQQYLFGLLMIVLILGCLNSFGLWIIGIDNPLLFGFLAAVLAIIPYVGTLLGAAIPIVYAFMTYDSLWMPITIALFYSFIQFVDNNFLTPKIVGGNLKINALTSILSIIIGASVWGVAGMILFLPLAAMFKVVCEQYYELKPIALLLGDSVMDEKKKKNKIAFWPNRIKK
jgi:predicted PurR-regulated permease PerM